MRKISELLRDDRAEAIQLAERLDAMSWGLFFVWIGVAFLADIGLGAGLLGVAIIILGQEAARSYFKLPLDGFWLVVALIFLVGGIWEFLNVEMPLVPVLLIVAGVLLLASALIGKRLTKSKISSE